MEQNNISTVEAMLDTYDKLSFYLKNFTLHIVDTTNPNQNTIQDKQATTQIYTDKFENRNIVKYINEFWTSKQRQASSLHEISYRACFKPQLPRFFIEQLTQPEDIVYDPFTGRGTTPIEAALLGRNIIANDINPLSKILTLPRLQIPTIEQIQKRLNDVILEKNIHADIDLSMFYHKQTESELVSLKQYLYKRDIDGTEDFIDRWIRMIATNRLTGHSTGFFSVYTLPPNQAVTQDSQRKINQKRNQEPPYRNVKEIILEKSRTLLKDISERERKMLSKIAEKADFIIEDSRNTKIISKDSVKLTVTSPPFLNVVQYAKDNWLRCWFNSIDAEEVAKKITMSKTIEQWSTVMGDVFKELYRITLPGGWVAFEVGEVQKGKTQLEDHVVPLGINSGFDCFGVLINQQEFTKTSNIWGINNNSRGTNSNRIVIFRK